MAFDSTSFRQLAQNSSYVRFNTDFSEKDYQIAAYWMLPMGIFLVLQGHPRRKIVNVLLGFSLAFSYFGDGIISGTDTASRVTEGLKLIALGGVLGVISHKVECVGYTMLGLFSGMLPAMTLLFQLYQVTSTYSVDQLLSDYGNVVAITVLMGLIVPCLFQEHIVMPLSLALGASMIVMPLAIFDQGTKFYNSLYQKRTQYWMIEGIAIVVGFLVQHFFKKREQKLNEEVRKQRDQENEKKYGAANAYYQNMKAAAAQSQPVIMNPVPQPMYMNMNMAPMNMMYSPLLPQPMYQQPLVPTRMDVSNNVPRHQSTVSPPVPRHQTTATVPPPKEEHKSIADIQANLSQINVNSKTNQYEF